MKRFWCVMVAIILIVSALSVSVSAAIAASDEARALYEQYAADFISLYDANGDHKIDGNDVSAAKRKMKEAVDAGAEYAGAAPEEIAAFLVNAPGCVLDVDRDGFWNNREALIAEDYKKQIEAAGLDYLGPSAEDFAAALGAIESGTYVEQIRRVERLEDDSASVDPDCLLAIEAIDAIGEVELTKECFDRICAAEAQLVKLTREQWAYVYNLEVYIQARATLDMLVPTGAYVLGDATGDGRINAQDIVAMIKYIIGYETEAIPGVMDMNGDGNVNARDVLIIMFAIVNGEDEVNICSVCALFGHKSSSAYATEIVHNAYSESPLCEKDTYLVVSCTRDDCGFIYKRLIDSARIASCHG